jgi:hypothetical protein
MRCAGVCLAVAAVSFLVVPPAPASELLGDRDVTDATLQVNGRGEALVSYTRSTGAPRRVLVWGAVNALPPSQSRPQVRFSYDYSGGWRKYGRPVWRTFANRCQVYDGPLLPNFVAACKAPDGSYWALQRWQRYVPMRGVAPFRPGHGSYELHVSHWAGPLPQLEVSPNWTYGGRWEGIFGRLTYQGVPVHGFRTPSATRPEPYARYVYIDTLNSRFGPGWQRAAGILTHVGNGAFCYSFVPQAPPSGYPASTSREPGNGDRHRVTVMGPGVTPVVRWEGAALGPYDRARDAGFNALFDRFVGSKDKVCRLER